MSSSRPTRGGRHARSGPPSSVPSPVPRTAIASNTGTGSRFPFNTIGERSQNETCPAASCAVNWPTSTSSAPAAFSSRAATLTVSPTTVTPSLAPIAVTNVVTAIELPKKASPSSATRSTWPLAWRRPRSRRGAGRSAHGAAGRAASRSANDRRWC